MLRDGLLVFNAIFKVFNILAGFLGFQYLLPLGHEFVMG